MRIPRAEFDALMLRVDKERAALELMEQLAKRVAPDWYREAVAARSAGEPREPDAGFRMILPTALDCSRATLSLDGTKLEGVSRAIITAEARETAQIHLELVTPVEVWVQGDAEPRWRIVHPITGHHVELVAAVFRSSGGSDCELWIAPNWTRQENSKGGDVVQALRQDQFRRGSQGTGGDPRVGEPGACPGNPGDQEPR